MDIITLAMLNGLKKSGGVGYTTIETVLAPGVLTFDGSIDGREYVSLGGAGYAVKLLDRVIDPSEATSATLVATLNGKVFDERTYTSAEELASVISLEGLVWPVTEEMVEQAAADGLTLTVGTWVVMQVEQQSGGEIRYYATEIHGVLMPTETETIHPIDPKFLPGVCLPVVEITTSHVQEATPLNEVDSATMEAMVESGAQFILVTMIVGGFVAGNTILRRADIEGVPTFSGSYNIPSVATSASDNSDCKIPAMLISKDPESNIWAISVYYFG